MRTRKLNDGQLTLVHADCLNYLPKLPDNSVDLIVTDPPYFKVKRHAWDNQWSDVTEFLAWLDDVLLEFWRVLKPNGSMYLFCSSNLPATRSCSFDNVSKCSVISYGQSRLARGTKCTSQTCAPISHPQSGSYSQVTIAQKVLLKAARVTRRNAPSSNSKCSSH